MSWLVIALGSLLSVAGAGVIVLGIEVAARDERGWTQVISGSVGLSAGIITIALGLLLMRLGGMRRDLGRLLGRLPDLGASALPLSTAHELATSRASGDLTLAGTASASTERVNTAPLADVLHDGHGGSGAAVVAEPPRESASVSSAPRDTSGHEAAAGISESAHAGYADQRYPPLSARADTVLDDASGAEAGHDHAGAAIFADAPTDTPPNASPHSMVVGQYEANGVAYIMYADGSIEADTPNGVYRFASITELKQFIEGRGAAG